MKLVRLFRLLTKLKSPVLNRKHKQNLILQLAMKRWHPQSMTALTTTLGLQPARLVHTDWAISYTQYLMPRFELVSR